MSLQDKPTAIRTMDEAEPNAGWSAIPIAFVVLLALLAYWGMVFLSDHGGGFNAQVYAPYSSFEAVDAAQVKSPEEEARINGKRIFTTSCAVCHQASGLGAPGQYPPLAGSEWVLAPKPDRIIRVVLNGFQGPVQVSGQQFNNVMVPWRDTLTKDEDIAAVLTYVRNEWGNKAPAVTAEEVKAIRDATAKKDGSWTAPDLQPIPDR
jgi:mono/diheme cytochrome c family protein